MTGAVAERYDMILEDVENLPSGKPTIVELAWMFPKTLESFVQRRRVVWLMATETFRRDRYKDRDFARTWFAQSSDPEKLFENLMSAISIMTAQLAKTLIGKEHFTFTIDGAMTQDEVAEAVASTLGLK